MTPEQLAKSGSEDGEQMALFAWATMAARYGFAVAWNMEAYESREKAEFLAEQRRHITHDVRPLNYQLDYMFAIPNGGLRHKATAGRLKATGVKSGAPDIMLPVSVGRWLGLFVELKRKTKGRVSPEQKHWIAALTSNGYRAYVCEGWRHAAESIQYYLEGKDVYER